MEWILVVAVLLVATSTVTFLGAPDMLGSLLERVTNVLVRSKPSGIGEAGLIGAPAAASTSIPETGGSETGWVVVRGETWRARVEENPSTPIEPGTRLTVVSVDGLVLCVERAADRS